MPVLTDRRTVTRASTATLTGTRDNLRDLFASQGVATRAADAVIQAGVIVYGVASIAVWALALGVAARRSGHSVGPEIF